MKPIDRALADAARQLSATSDTARLDAELLMAEAMHIDRDRLILSPPKRDVPKRFWTMVERREKGEPVAYITGRRAFWNIDLHVGPGVLVPRPDSEVLIASAIEHFVGGDGPRRILDLGTGPGTLLLAALDIWPVATGVGVDVSRHALSYAAANARRLGFEPRAKLQLGDWADGIDESFDLILCNPPYVADGAELGPGVREYEPDEALFAGEQGLDAYRALAPQLPRLLNAGGIAAVEIGPDQSHAVTALLQRDGLTARVANDFADRPRAVLLTWNLSASGRNCLAWRPGATTSGPWARPAPDQLTSAPAPTPTQSAVRFAPGAKTGTRGSEPRSVTRSPARLRRKGPRGITART